MSLPVIKQQPASQAVVIGANVTFSVVATGAAIYQWYHNGAAIGINDETGIQATGYQTAMLTLPAVTAAAAGDYLCLCSDGAGHQLFSAAAVLTVMAASTGTGTGTGSSAQKPVITQQPVAQTVAWGATVVLSVTASSPDGSALTYQWARASVAISGAKSATLTLPAVTAASAGSYSVAVSNPAGATQSAAAAVTVLTGSGAGTGTLAGDWVVSVGNVGSTAAQLGISEIARSRASLAADTCEITVGGRNVDADALLAYQATVTILRAGVVWFVGRVTETPASGSGNGQNQTYKLSGPWWYLEHLTYRQQWTFKNGAKEEFIGRLILGQALDGTLQTTGQVVTEMLAYAIDAGAPFQIGTILPGFLIPFDEVKDVTCAEVFHKMARWHPDAVAWFDYSTAPVPTLHFRAQDDLGTATLTVGSRPLVSIGAISPRYDLQSPAVVIHYEIKGSTGGQAYTDIATDAAPAGATGKEFGATVLTIPLRGQSSTGLNQPIIAVPIEDTLTDDDGSANANLVPFLTTLYGPLAVAADDPDITADGITITKIDRALSDPDAIEYDPAGGTEPDPNNPGDMRPKTQPVVYDDSLGNLLVQGSISQEMKQQFALVAQEQRLTFRYTLDNGSGDSDGAAGANYSDVGDEMTATVDIIATNATTSLYSVLSSYTAGDAVPTGLAASYLATLSVLQWSGSVVLEEQTAGTAVPAAALGSVLNLAGSQQPAWAAMNALIVQESVQASSGRTTLTFGPAKHLTPSEMVARLRVTRPGGMTGREGTGAKGTDNSDARTTGAPGTGNTIGGGTAYPKKNATSVPPKASDAVVLPMPFDVIAPGDPGNTSTVYGQVNPFSLFRPSELGTDTMAVQNLGQAFELKPGMLVYLQVDTDDGLTASEASVVWNTQGFGDSLVVTTNTGSSDEPDYEWDQSFFVLAQVFACADGKATQGGTVFASGDGTAFVEVVNRCGSHLSLVGVTASGVGAQGVIKSSAAS